MRPCRISARGGLEGGRLLVFKSLPSTNRWAIEHLSELRHGDVIRAVRQTAGQGRFGREWVSPEDRGLAVSFILETARLGGDLSSRLTQAAALAARATLAAMGLDAKVKWPNDVWVMGRKIAGMLAEGRSDAGAVVVGVGINVNLTAQDLSRGPWGSAATSVCLQAGRVCDVGRLAARLTREMARALAALRTGGAGWLTGEWDAHDALRECDITVQTGQGSVAGRYLGVAPDGGLMMRLGDGEVRDFLSGDVTLRGKGI